MPVIDTESTMRDTPRVARRVRFEPGVTAGGQTLTATNVQDAIDQIAAFTDIDVSGASVTISDTAPSSPAAGNLWWNSTTGQLGIYYNDGTSSQWVVVGAASASSLGGTGGSTPIVYTTAVTGAGTYVVPAGYSNLVGEAWGSGGGGGNNNNPSCSGGGGGGYSRFSIPVIASQTIYYFVGTGGVAGSPAANGTNSWVNPAANAQPTSSGCVGGGGGGSNNAPGGGGPGSVGSVNYQGGSGVTLGGGSGSGSGGGGGGGAGSAGNGVTASSTAGGAGGSPDGGAGGMGGTYLGAGGTTGATPGGGGGGNTAGTAYSGGPGQIKLTIT